MNIKNFGKIVTIFGGSGFVGSALVKEFVNANYIVNIVSRDEEKASKLKTYSVPGRINVIKANLKDSKQIENAIIGSDFVINLIATFDDSEVYNFQYLHAQLPERIAKFCVAHSVKKFIHISNLGIDTGVSIFAKTRLLGENAVLASFKDSIIIRSSLIVGESDSFLRILMIIAKKFRFIPLIQDSKHEIKVQPIYVEDLAKSFVWLLENGVSQNLYKIAGPEIIDLKQICLEIKNVIKGKVFMLPINIKILKILAKIFSLRIFSPIHGFIFGTRRSPLSSEKIDAINFNGRIERNEQNLLFKVMKEPTKLSDVVRKIYDFLF